MSSGQRKTSSYDKVFHRTNLTISSCSEGSRKTEKDSKVSWQETLNAKGLLFLCGSGYQAAIGFLMHVTRLLQQY